MTIKKVSKIFARHSVGVFGEKGSGKDLLFGNVIARRKLPYVSNTNYGGKFSPLKLEDIQCGGNTYRNFLTGKLNQFVCPYVDKTDVYLADAGIYFPSQYCNELNRDHKEVTVYEAISRHLNRGAIHYNTQFLGRVWDKIREQCSRYIMCVWSVYICGIVIQKIRIYEKYDSAANKVLPWRVRLPLFANRSMKLSYDLASQSYHNTHGFIKEKILIYRNKSKHNTRLFKEILENA